MGGGWEEGRKKERERIRGEGGEGGRGLLGSISKLCLELTSPHTQLCSQLSEVRYDTKLSTSDTKYM